jgi:hypothetical protein
MVIMVNQESLDGRRIYLNVPHSANVKPSWTGESVGHYEGDTLVVDTIGINDKTYIDNFRTPHTENLHVVERFRMIDDGNILEANIRVEDPGAFTMPWNAGPSLQNLPGKLTPVGCRARRGRRAASLRAGTKSCPSPSWRASFSVSRTGSSATFRSRTTSSA